MAYTAPVIDASGQSLANLQAGGFDGYLATLVANLTTNAATPAQIALVHQLTHKVGCAAFLERVRNVVDNYISGKPVSIANLEAEVYDLQLALAAAAAALGEIGALMDAHQGTLNWVASAAGLPSQVRTLS